jgi:hypothetical protein
MEDGRPCHERDSVTRRILFYQGSSNQSTYLMTTDGFQNFGCIVVENIK